MGDLPSPVKRHIESITGDNNPIDQIEQEIAPWLTELRVQLRNEHLFIVKLADLIDALVSISEEGIGNHAQKVVQVLRKMLEDKLEECQKKYTQYNWHYTVDLLRELLQSHDETKIKLEYL